MLHQGKLSQQYAKLRFFTDKPWANGTLLSKARNGLREAVAMLGVRKTLTIHCPDKEYTLYKGAAWWAITPDLAHDVLNQWDNNEHLVGYFKTSFCPAETFVQTVAFNSPKYADRCMLAQGRYKSLTALTPLTFIDYSTNIKILDEFDFDRITKSGKMFCRKVVERPAHDTDRRRKKRDGRRKIADYKSQSFSRALSISPLRSLLPISRQWAM